MLHLVPVHLPHTYYRVHAIASATQLGPVVKLSKETARAILTAWCAAVMHHVHNSIAYCRLRSRTIDASCLGLKQL